MRYLVFFILLIWVPRIYAYTLPYPSYMPGHKLYVASRTFDKFKTFWYWGNIGTSKYNTALSDKYLVEAKTLFEYKQYLLAVDALNRSDEYFKKINPKNNEQVKIHNETLVKLKDLLPTEFLWQPEKQLPTRLMLHNLLDSSIKLRNE